MSSPDPQARSAAGTAAILLLCLAVGACGFSPLYRQQSGGSVNTIAAFQSITIGRIAERSGQLLRNALRDRITPRGQPTTPAYRLEVALAENRSDLVLLKDATATFAKLRMVAKYALLAMPAGNPVTRGRSESTAIFNIVESEFANLSAENDARRRAVVEISDDIRLRLGLYFQSAGATASGGSGG